MRALVMNTCGDAGLIALSEDGVLVTTETLPGRGTSEALMPAIGRLFAEAGWTVADLGLLAIVNGPGSFTGVRVGLSAAKGLCEAGAVGMVALSRLALVAAGLSGQVVALLDGGRGEFYCGQYKDGVCQGEELADRDRVAVVAAGARLVTCEIRVQTALPDFAVALVDEPAAEIVLEAATQRVARGEWTDVATVDANYLRRTDAELLVERRNLALAGANTIPSAGKL